MAIALGAHVSAATGVAGLAITTATRTTSATGSTFSVAVVWFAAGGPGVAPTITDSKGNLTWAQVGSTLAVGNNRAAIFECVNGAGGTLHTFTATFLANQDVISIWANEITGALTASPRDQAPGGNDDTASPYTSLTTGTTAQANEILIAYGFTLSVSGTETFTWGNSFTGTGDDQGNANADFTGTSATRVVSAVGTYQASFTSSGAGSTEAMVFIVTYKDITPGGGGAITDQVPLQVALVAPTPKLAPPRRVDTVAPVGTLMSPPVLSSLGWLVVDAAPRPRASSRRMAVIATAGIGANGITLPWIEFAVPDPVAHRAVARRVEAVAPVGTLITPAVLTSIGWLHVDQRARPPMPLQRAPVPAQPTSPLVPFVSASVGWMGSESRATPPLLPRAQDAAQPTSPLTPFVSASVGWLSTEARSPALPAPRAQEAQQPTSSLVPFVSASTGWLSTPSSPPVLPRPRAQDTAQPDGPLAPFVSPSLGWQVPDAPRAAPLTAQRPDISAPVGSLLPTLSASLGWLVVDTTRGSAQVQRVLPTDPVGSLLTPQPFGWNSGHDQARPAPVVPRRVEAVAPVGTLMSIQLPPNGWVVTDNPRTPYRTQPAVVVDPVGNLLFVPPLPSIGWLQTDNPRTPYRTQRAVVVDPVGTAFPFLPKFGPHWFADSGPRAPAPSRQPQPTDPVGAPLAQLASVGWLSTVDARPAAARAARPEPSQHVGPIQFGGAPWATVESQPARVASRAVDAVQPIGPLVPFVSASVGWMSAEQRPARATSQRAEVVAPVGSPLALTLTSLGWLVVDAPRAAAARRAQLEPAQPVGQGFFPQVSSSLGWMLVDATSRAFQPPRVFASEPVGQRIVAAVLSAAPWASTPTSPPALVARRVYPVEPVGVFMPPPVFTSIAWMSVEVVRRPDVRHGAVVVDPVGDRLPPPRPLLPASAQFTARVQPDEYIAYVRFDTLEIRRR